MLFLAIGSYLLISSTKETEMPQKTFATLQNREKIQIKLTNQQAAVAVVAQNSTPPEGEQVADQSHTLTVEVVNTPAAMAQGLSGRTEIGADGMLFIFPTKEIKYFWMKDMQFDIDIVWIAGETVVGVSEQVPKPEAGTPDFRLETYSSSEPVNIVLELPSGDAKQLNISSGTVVQLVQ